MIRLQRDMIRAGVNHSPDQSSQRLVRRSVQSASREFATRRITDVMQKRKIDGCDPDFCRHHAKHAVVLCRFTVKLVHWVKRLLLCRIFSAPTNRPKPATARWPHRQPVAQTFG